MKASLVLGCLVITSSLLMSACGTARVYTLPVTAAQAPQTYVPLMACATQQSLQSRQQGDSVEVFFDETAMIRYGVEDSGNALAMGVLIDDKKVPANELEAKFSKVKATGDAIFACAQATPTPATTQPGTPTPTVGNTVSSMGNVQGNWTAKINYTYSCTIPMNKPEVSDATGSWSLTLSGQPQQLTAEVNTTPRGYTLNGSSSSGGMRLCGAFPVKGKGGTANTQDNNVCMVVSEVMNPNKMLGHIEGEYATDISNCKIKQAKLELTR